MWLKLVLLSTLICFSFTHPEGKKQRCKELEECAKGENDVSCVKRYKRHCQGSSNSCNECDCEYCSDHDCSSTCNTCCANFVQPCSSNYCCYKTCHAQCASNACRKSCRSSCTKKITESQTIGGSSKMQQAQAVNVTTVINLHNKINNTNEIDIPVNVNSTNYNNFTIDAASEFQGQLRSGQEPSIVIPSPQPLPIVPTPTPAPQIAPPMQQPSCCQVVSPRQCVPQPRYPYTRCFHFRRKQCGSICTSQIMHAQPHQVCEEVNAGQRSCHNQLIYIPQPQTRCTYQQTWPYVNCGLQQPNCDGCYGPLVTEAKKQTCSPHCFQDPFADGQYFRQGPVFGQGFPGGPMMGGPPMGEFMPTYDNSFSIAMDPSKRSSHESNGISPPLDEMAPFIDPSPKPDLINGNINGVHKNLPIEVIQDGVTINEIPSSFMPLNPYPQYPPYPYLPPPGPYPYWPPPPPPPPYVGIPPPEVEAPPLFAENNYLYKRGADGTSMATKKDEPSVKKSSDPSENNIIPEDKVDGEKKIRK